jgi:hypothetical protein
MADGSLAHSRAELSFLGTAAADLSTIASRVSFILTEVGPPNGPSRSTTE